MTSRPRPSALLLLGLLSWLCLIPAPSQAQIRLGEAQVTFPQDFGSIQTVRALPDGRVLVADPLGKALFLVDLDGGTRTVVGREGQGPEEYLQPDAVWPLPGDSTLLVDLGNGRLVALDGDLRFGPTQPIMVGEFRPGSPLTLALPVGVDGEGNIYTRSMGAMGGSYPDSADILRIHRGDRSTEVVGRIKIREVTQETSGGANNQRVAISPIPLSPEDAWGVAQDGTVVVARAGDYHLDRIGPDGSVTRGPAVPFESISIGTAEKEEYLAEDGRSGGGVRVGVTMDNGQMAMSFARGGGDTTARQISQYTWPQEMAPIYAGRIPIDQEGRAWVRRHVEAGEESTYDVFHTSGNRMETVLLPHGKRILGFGEGVIYVVAYDEFDLNYLERYSMPGF